MNEFRISETRCVQYEIEILIMAPRDLVWSGLTGRINEWWLDDFRMLGIESRITLESHAGGRLFEKNGNAELLWYTVLSLVPSESMSVIGHCTAEFGGPSTSFLTVRLLAENSGTKLTIQDSLTGVVTDGHAESLRSGWLQLFSIGLKKWAEGLRAVSLQDQAD